MSEPTILDGLTLHPEMRLLLDLRAKRNQPPAAEVPLDELRALALRDAIVAAGEPVPVDTVTDLTVPGPAGPLRARLYAPGTWDSLLLFFHGGAFVFGDVDSHDGVCRLLSAEGGFAVLSVEYRLSPEHRFPAAFDDAWAAWQWTVDHATTLPGAPAGPTLAIGGDSAGGLLAAAACQLAVRSAVRAPALQLLLYPAISRDAEAGSMRLFGEGFYLTRTDIDFFEACLLGDEPDDLTDFRCNPLVGDLAGLAPAYVVTAGFDPLRDGGEAYAAGLTDAGTPAVLRRHDSLIHGFVNMIGFSPAARAATVEIAHETAKLLTRAAPTHA
jgi:acetyl esterase